MQLSSGVVYNLAAIGHKIGGHQPNMRKGIKTNGIISRHTVTWRLTLSCYGPVSG